MKSMMKTLGALAGAALTIGAIVAASADNPSDHNSGPIWLAQPAQLVTGPGDVRPGLVPAKPIDVASLDTPFAPATPAVASDAPVAPASSPTPAASAPPVITTPPAVSQTAPPPPAAPAFDPMLDTSVVPAPQLAQSVPSIPPAPPAAMPPVIKAQAPPVITGPPPAAPVNPPVTQATFTGTSGKDLNIEINRGALVRLPVPADTVFVANPEIADIQVKSPRLIYVFGKRAGETVLYAVDGNDNLLLNTRVVVTHNLQALRTAIGSMLPGGGISITTAGDALVLDGAVSSAAQADDIRRVAARFAPGDGAVVNNLKIVAPNQVNLRVRIAEVSRDTLKQFGINWDNAVRLGGFVFGLATGSPVINTVAGANLGKTIVRNEGTNSIVGSFRKGNVDLNTVIDALANENLITVLAEPNLTAMSGETANFLAGGEFPIPVPQSGTSNVITVEFKKFGVSLAFTPTVIDGNRINLKVRPEVSQLSTVGSIVINSISIPALTTRNAETTVELGSGQSFAIAGLLQHNSQQDVSKTPFLGDIPILGALFKSDRYQRNETELVIVVTPYLVKPVSPNAIATPVDGLTPPTDVQRIFYGTKNQQKLPEAGNVPRGRDGNTVIGPAGFQLD